MLIVDTHHDYYDFAFPHLTDKKIVYQRNSQVVLGSEIFFNPTRFRIDRERTWNKFWQRWDAPSWDFGLYVGYEYFKFTVVRYLEKEKTIIEYMQTEEEERDRRIRESKKRPSNAAILLLSDYGLYEDHYAGSWLPFVTWDKRESICIQNPILKNTWIPKLLSPESVWTNVYNYLVATKNEPVQDSRTNDEKVLSAGFDLKSSFRNVK